MLITHQHPHNRSITIGILGSPNVGKSSLVNYLLGFDLSIVTDRPQTTRHFFHCVLTVDRTEIILVDTPGLHESNKEINKRINQQVHDAIEGTDVNILLIDSRESVDTQLEEYRKFFTDKEVSAWVVFTKCDLLEDTAKFELEVAKPLLTKLPSVRRYFMTSAISGDGMHDLIGAICDHAPNLPHHYPDGAASNKTERFFAAEYIREQAFKILRDEVPYELAVMIDSFREVRTDERVPGVRGKDFNPYAHILAEQDAAGASGEGAKPDRREEESRPEEAEKERVVAHIQATILVNRPSQRAIVVGSGGANIRTIGTNARQKIEAMLGGKIFLNLHVKVVPKWFSNNAILEKLDLPRAEGSNRVWRKRDGEE